MYSTAFCPLSEVSSLTELIRAFFALYSDTFSNPPRKRDVLSHRGSKSSQLRLISSTFPSAVQDSIESSSVYNRTKLYTLFPLYY